MKKMILFIAMFLLMSSNALASYTIYVLNTTGGGVFKTYRNVEKIATYIDGCYHFYINGKSFYTPINLTIIEEE